MISVAFERRRGRAAIFGSRTQGRMSAHPADYSRQHRVRDLGAKSAVCVPPELPSEMIAGAASLEAAVEG